MGEDTYDAIYPTVLLLNITIKKYILVLHVHLHTTADRKD